LGNSCARSINTFVRNDLRAFSKASVMLARKTQLNRM
jgi:hypothetical protein